MSADPVAGAALARGDGRVVGQRDGGVVRFAAAG